jgi:hypothetical protein
MIGERGCPMKSRWVLITLSALLCTVGVLLGCVHMFYPSPETQSAFLKNYTPTNVLNRFNKGQGGSYLDGRTAEAGHESVTHTATFNGYFALSSETWMPLMDALRDDVATQLVGNGARILGQGGDARAGFHFDYKLGKTVGSVTISPLELTPLLSRRMPLPNGMVDAHTSIEVAEKWFPKEPGLIQLRVSSSIQ